MLHRSQKIHSMLGGVIVQPLDLIKNRMQLSGVGGKARQTSFEVVKNIIANEGILALYNGVSAGLLRQATYTTTRLGIYSTLFDLFKSKDGTPPNFATKAALGMVAGIAGSFVGTPADVALIRMTADGKLPVEFLRIQNMKTIDGKPEYSGAPDVLAKILKKEGVFALWKGFTPYYARLGPHTVLTFIFLEQMTHAYKKYILGDDDPSGAL